MRLIDITRTVQAAPIYSGSSPVEIVQVSAINRGDAYNSSVITTGAHMGTHADALCHFIEGSTPIGEMPLEQYIGPCRVLTVPENALLPATAFAGRLEGCERLVLHGGGESYLTREAAEYIAACGVVTVVTDAWSVAPLDNEAEIHRILLGAKIAVVENVILDGVADGDYLIFCPPIKYAGCDGAPVRAVLVAVDD